MCLLGSSNVHASTQTQCRQVAANHSRWSKGELWIWSRLCAAEVATIERAVDGSVAPGSPVPGGQVSTEFIGTLISDPSATDALRPKGIRIVGAEFTAPVDLSNYKVNVPLALESSLFKREVNISGMSSVYEISFSGSRFEDGLIGQTMDIATVSLVNTSAQDIDFSGSRIKGWLRIEGLRVKRNFYGDQLYIDGSIIANEGCQFEGRTIWKYLRTTGNVTVADSTLNYLDLSGARIDGELQFGFTKERATRWMPEGMLLLRATKVGGLRGWTEPWPKMVLDGFSYNTFQISGLPDRHADWYVTWLAGANFSMQAYRRLSDHLRQEGRREDSDAVLFAGLERQRSTTRSSRYALMSLERYLIGYGIGVGYFNVVVVALFLVVVGRAVLSFSAENDHHVTKLGTLYSVATLIPVVTLEQSYSDLRLETALARRYFYFHKVCGYILTSYVLLGVTGLASN